MLIVSKMYNRIFLYFVLINLFTDSLHTQVIAQLPAARITAVFPMGCKAGSEVEIKIHGSDLDGATGLFFSQVGISGKLINSVEKKFLVKVNRSVPPGVYDMRFIGAFGVSNPRPFVVGKLNELNSPGTNNSIENAFLINNQSIVNGNILPRMSQWFKLSSVQGQRTLMRLSTDSIDSKLNPIMILRNESGGRISRADRSGLIDYTATSNGDLYIQIHDASFAGGVDFFFRVEIITDGLHVEFIYPSACINSDTAKVSLYGRNLPDSELSLFKGQDGKQLERLLVNFSDLVQSSLPGGLSLSPSSALLKGGIYRFSDKVHQSNPFFLLHENGLPVIEETVLEPSQLIISPVVVSGMFHPERDVDSFKFTLEKEENYQLDLVSQRLGFASNPFVTAQIINLSSKGEESPEEVKEFYETKVNPGGREFNIANRDVTWRFRTKSDGYLKVVLKDLFNQVSGSVLKPYILRVQKEVPEYQLVVHPQSIPIDKNKRNIDLMGLHLRKGGCLPLRVVAIRKGGFNGPIKIIAEDLPKGVYLESTELKQGQNSITTFLVESDIVEDFVGDVKFFGLANIEGHEVKALAKNAVTIHRVGDYNNEPVLSRLAAESVLSVNTSDLEPIIVIPEGKSVFKGEVNSKINIPLSIERHGEFSVNFKLKAFGISQLDKLGELEVKNDQNKISLEIDLAKFKVPVGSHKFYLASTVKGKFHYPPLNGKKTDKKKDVNYRFFTSHIFLDVLPATNKTKNAAK